MIWLNPMGVTLGGQSLSEVESVLVDEQSQRLVVEHSDDGPHAVFADVPERRVVVKILRRVIGNEVAVPRPGDLGVLSFRSAPTGASASGVAVSATVVVTDVKHEIDRKRGAWQTVLAVAVSSDGAVHPVVQSVSSS